MNWLVRFVYTVTLTSVFFQENVTSVHIDVTNTSYKNYIQIQDDNLQPIEHDYGSDEIKVEKWKSQDLKQFDIEKYVNVPPKAVESEKLVFNTNKNRVVRQANGSLYPRLVSPYYGNNQYNPGQATPTNNPQWDGNSNYNNLRPYNAHNGYNNSYSSNPLANTTFNGYPSSYPSSQNNYYKNHGSPYSNNSSYPNRYNNSSAFNPLANITFNGYPSSTPNYYYNRPGLPNNTAKGSQNNFYNSSRPSSQHPYDRSSSRYPTYISTTPKGSFNGYTNNSYYGQGQFNGNSPSYPTSTQFTGQNSSRPWQSNPPYGYPTNNTRPNPYNSYYNTSPRYPQGQSTNDPRNVPSYNGGYPTPTSPQYNTGGTQPASVYGQNNSSYDQQRNLNSYRNNSRPINGYNNSYPHGYNNHNDYNFPNTYPGSRYNNNSSGVYPTPPSYNNISPRPSFDGYPLPYNNNNQNQGNWNPVQPGYNSNSRSPYENPNLFNYPSKYNTTAYDPRNNPPHQFNY